MKYSFQKKTQWADHYTKQAKNDNYAARSVYKLKEIQAKYHVIKKGNRVLDLGCSPGSWLIYTSKIVGHKGYVVGIDLKPVELELPKNVSIFTSDIINYNTIFEEQIKTRFNSVISDMAPATTGNSWVDTTRSFDLCNTALKIADTTLLTGGTFVCKIFHGEDLKNFSNAVKKKFRKQLLFKPQSTRKSSREIYVVGLNKF